MCKIGVGNSGPPGPDLPTPGARDRLCFHEDVTAHERAPESSIRLQTELIRHMYILVWYVIIQKT